MIPVKLLADTARRYKLAIAMLFFLALALPSLEAAALTLVYLLLTPDQAVEAARTYLNDASYRLAVVGPYEDDAMFQRLLA